MKYASTLIAAVDGDKVAEADVNNSVPEDDRVSEALVIGEVPLPVELLRGVGATGVLSFILVATTMPPTTAP